MGKFTEKQMPYAKLAYASSRYFASCSRHVACLALMGLFVCPQVASADNAPVRFKVAKNVVFRSMGNASDDGTVTPGESGGGSQTQANDTIPYEQLRARNSWQSTNHDDNSSSEQSWEIKNTRSINLSLDYTVSSEQGYDWLVITLDNDTIVRASGSMTERISRSIDDVGRHVLTARYVKDGSGSSGTDVGIVNNISAGNIFTSAEELLNELGGMPGLKQELSETLEAAEALENEEEATALLLPIYNNVYLAHYYNTYIPTELEKANAILAEGAYVDIAEAVARANALDPATSKSAEYIAAYEALSTSVAVYNSSKVPMSDWNFDTSNIYLFNNLPICLDQTNKLVLFCGLHQNYPVGDTFELPATIRFGDDVYAVVAMINNWQHEQKDVRTVKLPKTLRYMADYALAYFPNMTEIEIPENVEQMGQNVLYADNNLRLVRSLPEVPPQLGSLWNGNVRYKVQIPRESFHAYRLVSAWNTNILIGGEDGVTVSTGKISSGDLGHVILDEAGYLQEVNKLVVDEGTFNNDDWKNIKNMSNLIELDLSGVTLDAVPASAFSGMTSLEKVLLPGSVQRIENNAFASTSIKEIALPEKLTYLGNYAFNNCYSLQAVDILEGVATIPSNCFNGCTSLSKIILHDGLTSIGDYAFYNCALTELDIPSSVQTIGSRAFYSNRQLDKLTLNEGLLSISSNAFTNCMALEKLECPSTLQTIGSGAFSGCQRISELKLNEGLVNIYSSAFASCDSLTSVVLPSSLEGCYDGVFSYCYNIKTFEARSVLPPSTNGTNPMRGVDLTSVQLYVPAWSVGEYQLAQGWNTFYTFLASDFMPQNIKVNKDFYFSLRDEIASDYRPNIEMTYSSQEKTDANGKSSYERGNLTVSGRSKLAVNDFSFVVSPYAKYYSDENINYDYNRNYRTPYNSTSLFVKGEMRAENVTLNLCNYCRRWQFVSFPFDVRVGDITPMLETTSWVIRSHSGENRAAGKTDEVWQDLKADDVLQAGKGYIMHCYDPNYENAWFTVKPLTNTVNRQLVFDPSDRVVALEENLSEFEHNRSWNFIGNPYPSFYDTRFLDFDAPFLVWNSYAQNYYAYSPADDAYILSPGEAFFVQRPVDQENITFLNDGRQIDEYPRTMEEQEAPAPQHARSLEVNRSVYNIRLTCGDMYDRTRVVISDKASLDYERSRDAAKFASTEASVPQIYSHYASSRYAINERPLASGEVALGIHCGTDGTYTIALQGEANGTVVLVDHEMNVSTEITADHGYTFDAKAGDYDKRFTLRLAPVATGIEGVATDGADNDDAADVYTIQGVRTTDANAKQQKGVYIQNGKKVIKK